MKGTDLSKTFFETIAKPIIERSSQNAMQQVSIGIIDQDEQSYIPDQQCFENTRKKPFFQVFLFEQNEDFQKSIYDNLTNGLPKTFQDFDILTKKVGNKTPNFEVWFWPDFTEHIVGLRRRPSDPLPYWKVPEAQIYTLLNGQIIWDPNQELEKAKLQWDHMPQEVWHWRLYWTLKNLSQRNSVSQALSFGEDTLAKLLFPRYVEWALRLSFLVARKHSPIRQLLLRVHKSLISMKSAHEHIISALECALVNEGFLHLEQALNEIKLKMIEKKFINENFIDADRSNELLNCEELAQYFLSNISSDFRNQATRICPIDLLGSLEQSAKNAP